MSLYEAGINLLSALSMSEGKEDLVLVFFSLLIFMVQRALSLSEMG